MQIKITPQYLQNGHILGYKAETYYKSKHLIAMSFESHKHALDRLYAHIFEYIGKHEGLNALQAYIKSPLSINE